MRAELVEVMAREILRWTNSDEWSEPAAAAALDAALTWLEAKEPTLDDPPYSFSLADLLAVLRKEETPE